MKLKKILLFIAVAFISSIIINQILASSLVLDKNELILLRKNGIISAMCFVQDMLSGTFSRTVMVIFILGTGWMIIMTGKMDWKTLLPIIIAVALMFGGAEFINIISKNNYTCESLKNLTDTDEEIIPNKGECFLTSIAEFRQGQVWGLCDTFGNNCDKKMIDKTVSINQDSIVSLIECESSAYKNNNENMLKYKCTQESEKFKFQLYGNNNTIDICRKVCMKNDLSKFFNNNPNYAPADKDKNIIPSGNDPYIISGKRIDIFNIIKYTDQTMFNLACKNGTVEFDITNNAISDQNPRPGFGVNLKCDEGLLKLENGICKKNCFLSGIKNYSKVQEWYICKDENSLDNCSLLTDNAKHIISDSFVRIKTCKDGFFVPNGDKTAILKCENGFWFEKNKSIFDRSSFCERGCNIDKIPNYELTENVTKCFFINSSGDDRKCEKNINISTLDNFKFGSNEYVIIDSCKENAKIYNPLIRNDGEQSKIDENNKSEFVCDENGSWKIIDSNFFCKRFCSFKEFTNSIESVANWSILTAEKRLILSNSNDDIIFANEHLQSKSCSVGYDIEPDKNNNSVKPALYKCNENTGKFSEASDKNICKKTCKFVDLKNLEPLVNVWKKCHSSGASCTSNLLIEEIFYYKQTAEMEFCTAGYELGPIAGVATKYECLDGEWKKIVNGSTCIIKSQDKK